MRTDRLQPTLEERFLDPDRAGWGAARRKASAPRPPKPASIMTQVEASGTGATAPAGGRMAAIRRAVFFAESLSDDRSSALRSCAIRTYRLSAE
jgi:hypothetical protein